MKKLIQWATCRAPKQLLVTSIVSIIVAIGASFGVAAHAADVVDAPSIFPAPACDVPTAAQSLRFRLSQIGVPTWDGELPWPQMVGYWENSIRDLYVTVSVDEISESEFGRIAVSLRSICGYQTKGDDNYLAFGAKIVTAADFKNHKLSVNLRNYKLNGNSLVAILEIIGPAANNDKSSKADLSNSYLRVTVKERTGSKTFKLVPKDSFIATRMQLSGFGNGYGDSAR